MSSKNASSLIGNLTADPNVQKTPAGDVVCNIRLALNRKFRRAGATELEEETTFVDVAIWGSRGEAFARMHKKGDLASIDGRLKNDEWTDKTTGQKREKLKIVCEEWYLVHGRKPEAGVSSF